MLPQINKILYVTDLGPGSAQVFRYALSLASRYQAQITILHIVEPLTPFAQNLVELYVSHEQSEAQHAEIRKHLLEKLQERLHDFCSKESCATEENLVAEILVVEGQPAQTIISEAARLNSDMIVMGTHQHSVIGEALLGSTAHNVLHSSTLPVLLVRVPEQQENNAGL